MLPRDAEDQAHRLHRRRGRERTRRTAPLGLQLGRRAAYDPGEAESQLDAAGWKRSGGGIREKGGKTLQFTLMYPAGDSVRKDVPLAFASDMDKIGVDVKLEGLSFDVIEKRLARWRSPNRSTRRRRTCATIPIPCRWSS